MKKIFFLLLFLGYSCLVQAQTDNVYISVAMPSDCTLDGNTKSILKNKLLQILSTEGVAGTECGAIIIVPEINIINSNSVYGGMRQILSVELGITVTVRNMITNTVFNTMQIASKGEGYSDNEAKRSAINKIDALNTDYSRFVEATKMKISDYYRNNTVSLITKANTLASQQLFDEALALLSTYPESLPGYTKVSNAMVSIFKKCQTQYCSQILLSAQAAYSKHDYTEAAELVSMIDAQSSCAAQAKALLNSIKKGMDKQYNDIIAMEKEKIRSDERIKSAQIKAIKDIATAYFKRQTEYIFFW